MTKQSYNIPKTDPNNIKKIKTVTFPIKCQHQYYIKRQYQVKIFYIGNDNLIHRKVVYFGFKQQQKPTKSSKKISRTNPFHPYFWQQRFLKNNKRLNNFGEILEQLKIDVQK